MVWVMNLMRQRRLLHSCTRHISNILIIYCTNILPGNIERNPKKTTKQRTVPHLSIGKVHCCLFFCSMCCSYGDCGFAFTVAR